MDLYSYLFIKLLSVFFFFMSRCKQNKTTMFIIGCNLSKHKLTLYKTQNGEPNYVARSYISFSLIFTRSYLPIQNLEDRHPNTIELASLVGWYMYCVTLSYMMSRSLLQCLLNTPWKYILLVPIFYLSGESPPSTFPL